MVTSVYIFGNKNEYMNYYQPELVQFGFRNMAGPRDIAFQLGSALANYSVFDNTPGRSSLRRCHCAQLWAVCFKYGVFSAVGCGARYWRPAPAPGCDLIGDAGRRGAAPAKIRSFVHPTLGRRECSRSD